jgi:hypothetical protein
MMFSLCLGLMNCCVDLMVPVFLVNWTYVMVTTKSQCMIRIK